MKDIVDLLEKNFPGEKKRTTVLTNEELNFVFETYTQQHQQDNLDSYYAYKVQSPAGKTGKSCCQKTAAKQPKEEKEVKDSHSRNSKSRLPSRKSSLLWKNTQKKKRLKRKIRRCP